MFNHNLNKREKKIAREIIDKGLMAEFENGLSDFYETLNNWKTKKLGTKESYYEIYQKVRDFDKKIGSRYDGITGSHYLRVVIEVLADGLVNTSEAEKFEPKTKVIIDRFLEEE